MPRERQAEPAGLAPGVIQYQVLCILALAVIFLIEVQREVLILSMLILLVGLLGVFLRLRGAPFLLLFIVASAELVRQFGWPRFGRAPLASSLLQPGDVLLSAATLGYVAAHYRLQALLLNVLPLDPRRRGGRPHWLWGRPPVLPQRRSARLVSPQELGLLLLALPACALVAQALWALLAPPRDYVELHPITIRLIIFAWLVGASILLARAVLRSWELRQMDTASATLLLQDIVWRETRREQRRAMRWLSWRRIKESNKE